MSDLATELRNLPDHTPVALSLAHLVVGVGQRTVYDWKDRGEIEVTEFDHILWVTAGEVRRRSATSRRGRKRTPPQDVLASSAKPQYSKSQVE